MLIALKRVRAKEQETELGKRNHRLFHRREDRSRFAVLCVGNFDLFHASAHSSRLLRCSIPIEDRIITTRIVDCRSENYLKRARMPAALVQRTLFVSTRAARRGAPSRTTPQEKIMESMEQSNDQHRRSAIVYHERVNLYDSCRFLRNRFVTILCSISYTPPLTSCAGKTCHARREFFPPKLQYFLGFKYIQI